VLTSASGSTVLLDSVSMSTVCFCPAYATNFSLFLEVVAMLLKSVFSRDSLTESEVLADAGVRRRVKASSSFQSLNDVSGVTARYVWQTKFSLKAVELLIHIGDRLSGPVPQEKLVACGLLGRLSEPVDINDFYSSWLALKLLLYITSISHKQQSVNTPVRFCVSLVPAEDVNLCLCRCYSNK